MTLASDIQKLTLSAVCEFYVLDTSPIGGALLLYFHSGVSGLGNDVKWSNPVGTGGAVQLTYSRWPIVASGFEISGRGTLPRPKLTVGDPMGVIAAYNYNYGDFVGSKLTRKRTLLKYLDAVNFPGGVNATADASVSFGEDVFTVDRKSSQSMLASEYELTTAFDVVGKQLPGRQIIQNSCTWIYRGSECNYTGTNYYDSLDVSTTAGNDVCGKHLSSCKLRFGASSVLPYGGFPAAGLLKV